MPVVRRLAKELDVPLVDVHRAFEDYDTTVLLEDGRTMIAVYPKGHGRGAIVMKRSADGGLTWSKARIVGSHERYPGAQPCEPGIIRSPDGRLVVPIRDMNKKSPWYGDFVLWVGTYDDILSGKEGQYRVHLLDNRGRPGDSGYSGLELLPDGTFVATTYCRMTKASQPLVISVRFTMKELDARLK